MSSKYMVGVGVQTIRERAANPEHYIRPSQHYTSSGFGFAAKKVADSLLLTAGYNGYYAADGEVEDTAALERAAFGCFRYLDLLDAPR